MKTFIFRRCAFVLLAALFMGGLAQDGFAKKKSKPALTLGDIKNADIKAKGHKVFIGEEGLTITVVELSTPKDLFLIEVKASGTDFDDKVLVHTIKPHDGGRRYSYDTVFKGEDFSTLFTEKDWWGNTIFFQNPTNYAKKFPLYYSDKQTKASNPIGIISRYAEKKPKK